MTSRAIALLLVALFAISCSSPTAADPFRIPDRVEVVVHSEPGGGIDLDAREWIRLLEMEGLVAGARWQVASRSGGAGARAMAYLADQRGRADVLAGMTLSWLVTPLTSAEARITYRDLTPIATLVDEPTVAAVRADSPYRTFGDVIAAARVRPGRLTQVGGQISSAHNVYREIIQLATGTSWSFVPLATRGERLAALLGGHVDLTFTEPAELREHVRAGSLRVLASIGPERVALYPDAPTLSELGINVELPRQWRGVIGPPQMARAAVAHYQDLFKRLSETRSWREFLERNGLRNGYLAGEALARELDRENEALLGVFREIGISVR
jgi:putative tricarboxylic transport membrane protein